MLPNCVHTNLSVLGKSDLLSWLTVPYSDLRQEDSSTGNVSAEEPASVPERTLALSLYTLFVANTRPSGYTSFKNPGPGNWHKATHAPPTLLCPVGPHGGPAPQVSWQRPTCNTVCKEEHCCQRHANTAVTGYSSVYTCIFRRYTGPVLFLCCVSFTDTPEEVHEQSDPLGDCPRRQRLAKEGLRMFATRPLSPVSPGELGDAVGTWETHAGPCTVYILETH